MQVLACARGGEEKSYPLSALPAEGGLSVNRGHPNGSRHPEKKIGEARDTYWK